MKMLKTLLFTVLFSICTFAFAAQNNIVVVAEKAGNLNTLVKAIKVAGLVKVLESKGPFTVFAPTDEAFAALPKGTLDGLLKDPKALAKVLQYHVVSGKVTSKEVKTGDVKTVNGEDIHLDVSADGVKVNDAKVVHADIEAGNGVVHVIDKVLLPSNK